MEPTLSAKLNTPAPNTFVFLINRERAKRNLNPLIYGGWLKFNAGINNTMQQTRGIGHWYMGPAYGQCVAWGATSEEQVFNLWMGSPPHEAIMMGPYSRFGLAKLGTYWTLDVK